MTAITDNLKKYFKSIEKLNPLTLDEEIDLATKAKNGDENALNKLIEHNLKIVVTIANKNKGRGIQIEDLIQQGNLGLYEAALRYDPTKGVRFSSFAATRILKSINHLIDTYGRIVRIPVNQEYERYKKIRDGKKVKNLSKVRLDNQIESKNSNKKEELINFILKIDADVDKSFDDEHNKKIIDSLLKTLNDRDKKIIKLYYGIDVESEMPTKDIAKNVGLTQVRVCQIINSTKNKFKKIINS